MFRPEAVEQPVSESRFGGIINSLTPLDNKIRNGIALVGPIDDEALERLTVHTGNIFNEMRADKTQEFGWCISYATGIVPTEEEMLDEFFSAVAVSQNHGMLSVSAGETEDGTIVWQGEDAARLFKLTKTPGAHIVMSDGSIKDGTIYCLLSTTRTSSPNGW